MAERRPKVDSLVETGQDALTVEHLQSEIQCLKMKLRQKEDELQEKETQVKESNVGMRGMLHLWNEFGEKLKDKVQCHSNLGKPKREPDKTSSALDKMQSAQKLLGSISLLAEVAESQEKRLKEREDLLTELALKHKDQIERLTLKVDDLETNLEKVTEERDKYLSEMTELCGRARGQRELHQELEKHNILVAKQKREIEVLNERQLELMQKLSQEWSGKISSSERDIENINIKNRPMNIVSEYETLFSQEWLDVKSELDVHCELSEDEKLTTLCTILLKAEKVANSKFREVMASVTENLQLPLCTMFTSPFVITKTSQTQTEDEGVLVYNSQSIQTQAQIQDASMAMDIDPHDQQQNITKVKGPASITESPGLPTDSGEMIMNRTEAADKTSPAKLLVSTENTLSSQWEACQYLRQSRTVLPINGETDLQTLTVPKHLKMTLHNTLGDILRLNADDANLGSLEMDVMQFIRDQFSEREQACICHNLSMKKYVTACCRICWKMAIQRPEMAFNCQGKNMSWDPRTQDVFFGAADPTLKTAVVSYYVKPSLVHGDKLMVKGQIMTTLCHPKGDFQHD